MRTARLFFLGGLCLYGPLVSAMAFKSLLDRTTECFFDNETACLARPLTRDADLILGYYYCMKHPEEIWQLFAEGYALEAHKKNILASAFIGNDFAVTGGVEGRLCLWDIGDKKKLHSSIEAHKQAIRAVVVSADQKYVLTGSNDGTARLWLVADIASAGTSHKPTPIREYLQQAPVTCMAFSSDMRFIVTGSTDGIVRLFDFELGLCIREYTFFTKVPQDDLQFVRTVRFSDDESLIVATADEIVKKWDRETGLEKAIFGKRILEEGAWCLSGAMTSTGDSFCGYLDGNISVISDLEPPRKKFKIASESINAVSIAADDRIMLVGTVSQEDVQACVQLCVCGTPSQRGEEFKLKSIKTFQQGETFVSTLAMSPDKGSFLVGMGNGSLTLWTIKRLAGRVGLKEARFVVSLRRRCEEGGSDPSPELRTLYENLEPEVKCAVASVYRISFSEWRPERDFD